MTDAFDLSSVVYHNSPSITDWPITSQLTKVTWANRRLTVVHEKTGQWAPVPFETTTQEATFWLFLFYGGKWHGAGAERFRPGQTEKELGSPFDMTSGWLYDAHRWGDMANRSLAPGETVAVCMTSGDMRSQMNPGPRERTAVRFAEVRADAINLWPVAVVETPPQPSEPPMDPEEYWKGTALELTRAVDTLIARVQAAEDLVGAARSDLAQADARIVSLTQRIEAMEQQPQPTEAVFRVSLQDVLRSRELRARLQ